MRELRGDLSYSEFARRLSDELRRHIDRSQVANWESGRYVPRADVLLAALTATSVPREHLPRPLGDASWAPQGPDSAAASRDDLQQRV